MFPPKPDSPTPETIQAAAAQWLARRDRDFTPAEQDAYLQWLREDPRHGAAVHRLEKAWGVLNQLSEWRPEHSTVPNPDLLAPHRASRFLRFSTALAALAAVLLAAYVWWPQSGSAPTPLPAPRHEAIIHPGPEKMTLADGSVVELNQGAKVEVDFTPAERRVRLLGGEAHFVVAKNPERPFYVDTGRVSVRAVGTAFSVSLGTNEVSVLVTEGKVQVLDHVVREAAPSPEGMAVEAAAPVMQALVLLSAGQRTVVDLRPREVIAPPVQEVTPAEVDRALAWQGMRLEFVDMTLDDVVKEFNRYNRQKLVVTDPETATIVVGGNFRADNVAAFVRLLDASFGVSAFPYGDHLVLRKTH